jgi:hypothetical protein
MWNFKSYYEQLHLTYLCNLARYWLRAPWWWHNSVETCRSSIIIYQIIVHWLVIVRNNKIKKLYFLFFFYWPQTSPLRMLVTAPATSSEQDNSWCTNNIHIVVNVSSRTFGSLNRTWSFVAFISYNFPYIWTPFFKCSEMITRLRTGAPKRFWCVLDGLYCHIVKDK